MGYAHASSDQDDDSGGADRERELHADERDAAADERESGLRARGVRARTRDATEADLREEVLGIMHAAEVRDEEADGRDAAAGQRDSAASLQSFLHDDEDQYDIASEARHAAAKDRLDAHTDRGSSAADRSRLTERSAAEPADEPE